MKQFFCIIGLLFLALIACPEAHSESQMTLTHEIGVIGFTYDGACRYLDISANVPAAAKAAYFNMVTQLASTNAIGAKYVYIQFFDNAECVGASSLNLYIQAREFVPLSANMIFLKETDYMILPVTAQKIYYKAFRAGGTLTYSLPFLSGYFE